ncbi:MAG: NTP transferase domain-containing protein [Candidatus Nezhaarchaeota archaeon]|nr:NTP transferase domain-containing protein [Candidatus Nezhaarchaeota archaeon]MCX8141274.1 NTP transferase domain-containing protein [Candidatus Nezhaarchaeota archaeon]MDW8049540.1 NTP transferase domain-containing protein [Nitrososphaerota archaeon]
MKFAGLVMAGGKGSRLEINIEKPLLSICGVSMLERVVGALRNSKYITSIFVTVTQWTPNTKRRAEELGLNVIETRGLGYVDDLREALKILWRRYYYREVVVVNSDIPLLNGSVVDEVITFYINSGAEALTVVIEVDSYTKLGFKADYQFEHQGIVVAPVGLNVVRADLVKNEELLREVVYVHPMTELLVNVNTISEAKKAEELLMKRRSCYNSIT